ncbi:circularly permuted type 2 ATP-grasp protein [Emcibacter sp.]|uniref:circularly permuted type 2 ATP-grasp protein n=1 Tax=Emcibacter sp. TaxID=1979954 RepID=UPI003A8DADD9
MTSDDFELNEFFDELRLPDGSPREGMEKFVHWMNEAPTEMLRVRQTEAEALFRRIGITFAVYGEGGDPERLIPFDILPRILLAREWEFLSRGLVQRVTALNRFLQDVYHKREIIAAGIVPERLVLMNKAYLPEMCGVQVPGGVYTHIAGIDLVRTGPDDFYVLEDNTRTPSGVSYMLQNREVMMRLFPDLFNRHAIAPVERYPDDLRDSLVTVAPHRCEGEPKVVVLSPGIYNSAYYEHSFLADTMGVELVEGQDLFVQDNTVFMRTTRGPEKVDVIYRRIDDAFLDPLTFRPDSTLGVPGLMNVYRSGGVTLANAVGGGIADDKAIYMYVPDMIRFYLGEEPILKNVPTYWCAREEDYKYVMDHLAELVVKEVDGSGGYGMLVGPKSTAEEIAAYAERIKAAPGEFIAQPTLALSTCPTFVEEGIAPRHVDLRPFVLVGSDKVRLVPGGLTRVAMKKDSLVVNSSQGGGTKDTWIIEKGRSGNA